MGLLLLTAACSFPSTSPSWTSFQSSHFELAAQRASEARARAALLWLEQIHSYFSLQTGFALGNSKRIRVIAFRSEEEYGPYRLASAADAYFAAAGGETYIVVSGVGEQRFRVLAHEFAHAALHSSRRELPAWLNEGLAEVYSTLQIIQGGMTLGGPIEAHRRTLQTHRGLTAEQLLSTEPERFRTDRDFAAQFYAHAWALTDMLMFSPAYAPHFRGFMDALASGTPDRTAIATVFGKDLLSIDRDLRAWADYGSYTTTSVIRSPRLQPELVLSKPLTPADSRVLLAGLLVAIGEYGRAAAEYRELARLQPQDGRLATALGAIALHEHDFDLARRKWKRALESGVSDPDLCYQYAMLADAVSMSAEEIRSALRHAIALKPDFDDARWKLALVESNSGHFEESAAQLKLMSTVPPPRAYAYWSALSYAEDEAGQHDAAAVAAKSAEAVASTDAERAHARELAYIAQTELAVRFVTDANGHREMVTARVPRGMAHGNPFVELSDRMRNVEGKLSDVHCADERLTSIVVGSGAETAQLAVKDPQQVQISNGPSELMCGPQPDARTVVVEYAAQSSGSVAGVVRGIRFK